MPSDEDVIPADADPFTLFGDWLARAKESEPVDPNAVCLATSDSTGQPRARMVLLKDFSPKGFVFYTNVESQKGADLHDNAKAAMCFYWKSLGRQIRVEGSVTSVSDEEADAYFASRPRGSRLGAWASRQSGSLPDRQVLEDRVRDVEAQYEGRDDIPRPAHWSGFCLVPLRIEFWEEGNYRLHHRREFTRESEQRTWETTLLYP